MLTSALFTPHKKALVILLGSNFDAIQETQFKFIDDLVSANFQVEVLSIDMDPLNFQSVSTEKPNVVVKRMLAEINADFLEKNFKADEMKKFEKIILVNGLHFSIQDIYTLVEDKFKKLEVKQIDTLHYISPKFDNATLNNEPIKYSTLCDLAVNINDFVATLSPENKNKLWITVLKTLQSKIDSGSKEAADGLFNGIIERRIPIKNPATREELMIFRKWLNEQVASKLSLSIKYLKPLESGCKDEKQFEADSKGSLYDPKPR
jgi:hypothetical protein